MTYQWAGTTSGTTWGPQAIIQAKTSTKATGTNEATPANPTEEAQRATTPAAKTLKEDVPSVRREAAHRQSQSRLTP